MATVVLVEHARYRGMSGSDQDIALMLPTFRERRMLPSERIEMPAITRSNAARRGQAP